MAACVLWRYPTLFFYLFVLPQQSIQIYLCLLYYQANEDELKDATILIFANKQDLPNALSVSEMTDKLGLRDLRGRKVVS